MKRYTRCIVFILRQSKGLSVLLSFFSFSLSIEIHFTRLPADSTNAMNWRTHNFYPCYYSNEIVCHRFCVRLCNVIYMQTAIQSPNGECTHTSRMRSGVREEC